MPKIIQPEELKVLTPDAEREITYKKEIVPLLTQLKTICEKNHFPIFITVCIDPNAQVSYKKGSTTKDLNTTEPKYESMYNNDFISSYDSFGNMVNLKPDYISECIKVINGWETRLPTKELMEEEDF